MKKNFFMLLTSMLLMLSIPIQALASANNYTNAEIPEEVTAENDSTLTLKHKIYIENFKNGVVSIINLQGEHTVIGTVYRPATVAKDSSDGFWAAHYDKASDGTYSCVTAIGTNAMHLKVGPEASYDPLNPTTWAPKQISVGIREDYTHAGGSYSNSMIYTSVAGGTNIFGGSCAPYVGNPVKYYTNSGTWESLDSYFNGDYTKAIPSRLMIEVYQASTADGSPDYIEFENWAEGDVAGGQEQSANGRVLVHYPNGTTKYVADVIQRVNGTGRFSGSEYAEVGRLRAAQQTTLNFLAIILGRILS